VSKHRDTTALVPAPADAPADEVLSADEILEFDPQATVATTVPGASTSVDVPQASVAPPGPAIQHTPASVVPENVIETTCPNCGHVGQVDFARREAAGFCETCDFPLFWSRDRVVLPSSGAQDESGLRRLPGTAGRAALSSLLCPSCREPNPATGVTCVRCGSLLHPVAPEPVVMVLEPEPEPEVVLEPARSWFPYLLAGGLALIALIAVLVILYR
jgi:hypothetical protein